MEKVQVTKDNYQFTTYDTKLRFCSYWHQIHEIMLTNPNSVLEVGIGNGFLRNYLKGIGVNVSTMDIDVELSPDIVGSVLNIPLENNSFEVTVCFQVLEHLPFNQFENALKEIYRVSEKYSIISLPNSKQVYKLELPIPKIGSFQKLLPVPKLPKEHKFDGQHFWEIGKKGYPTKNILSTIKRCGFNIIREYRVFENPYHHFIILKKSEKHY